MRLQCRKHRRSGFDPWVRKISWRRKWQPTPVFSPDKSHGQRSLVDYSPKGCKELDMTEHPYIYIYNWMDRSRKVSFARQDLWSASLIIWFLLLVNPTFFLWSTWDGRFSDSSVVKESTCKAGGPCSISGLGRSKEEGISYLLNNLGLPCWLTL